MSLRRHAAITRVLVTTMGLAIAALAATISLRGQGSYTVVTADNRRALPYRTVRGGEVVAIDQVASIFGLRVVEDAQVGGLTLEARGRRILLIADQSFAQVAGQVRTLTAPVTRERDTWLVPLDFLSDALAPLLGTRIEVRQVSHLVIVGDLRIPRVTGQVEPAGDHARLVFDVTPSAPARVTRDGDRLQIAFEANALDLGPVSGSAAGFVTGVRAQGANLFITLGPSTETVQSETLGSRVAIELSRAAPAAPPTPTPAGSTPGRPDLPNPADPTPGTFVRTIVLDPGHGGDDVGATGPGGLQEKDVTLRVARRLKTAIENRLGIRVLLTRDGDDPIPIDRRTALANNNKADLFISLHVNGAPGPDPSGAQVLTLGADDYASRRPAGGFGGTRIPAMGGGTRLIEAVPWDLAQLPHADASRTLGAIVARQLAAHGVPLFIRATDQLPLRALVGANMPAVQVEMGFLSNAGDAGALNGQDRPQAIVEAVVAAIIEVRNGIPATEGRGQEHR
ncbi:MAG: N-acetylmuramoyl-L-alanine amidase [Vicinamibacterales bacterium]